MFQKWLLSEPVTPKQRESITVDEPPIDDAGTQGLKDPELKKDVSPSPAPPLRRSQHLKSEIKETKEPSMHSSRTRAPTTRFKFDKAHGHNTTRHHLGAVLKACVAFHATKTTHNPNCMVALALDPMSGVMEDTSIFTPDFLNKNPNLFRAKKGNDPDTPGMMEAQHLQAVNQKAVERWSGTST